MIGREFVPSPSATRADRRSGYAAGGSVVVIALLATALRWVPDYSPNARIESVRQALRRGDLAALRGEGLAEPIDLAVKTEGAAEFAERIAIEDRAKSAGAAEFDRLREAILTLGDRAYQQLPRADQAEVRDRSLRTYLLAEGAASGRVTLPPDTRAETFAPEAPDVALATRLGRADLSPEERTRLGERTAAEASVQQDLALLELAVDTAEHGERLYASIRRQLLDAGERSFRALDADEQQRIRSASYAEFVMTRGFDAAPDELKSRIGEASVFLDAARAAAFLRSLGMRALPAADAARLQGFASEALGGSDDPRRAEFVRTHGERRVQESLRAFFTSARCETVSTRRSGGGAYDLFRRARAERREHCTVGDESIEWSISSVWSRAESRWALHQIEGWLAITHYRAGQSLVPPAPTLAPTDSEDPR